MNEYAHCMRLPVVPYVCKSNSRHFSPSLRPALCRTSTRLFTQLKLFEMCTQFIYRGRAVPLRLFFSIAFIWCHLQISNEWNWRRSICEIASISVNASTDKINKCCLKSWTNFIGINTKFLNSHTYNGRSGAQRLSRVSSEWGHLHALHHVLSPFLQQIHTILVHIVHDIRKSREHRHRVRRSHTWHAGRLQP